ncbi:hypothetical protein GOQ30_01435 [Flavobacterium sp. TP390]|uniref:Secreted protein n=1 Tax=Flavobacterium profundi TaxID=1774945 RepID=A0A6I4IDZ3_9FLAO|nr:hypothetical protein [Flavobacterium profundi]MVO07824.1 hypothetical protein [Flavobacterium profundi]
MKRLLLVVALLVSFFTNGKEKYKYVIVPEQFSFFKEPNQYNLNALTKSFFETEGFTVLYDTDKLPDELVKNRCLALYINAIENKSMFVTKIAINIRDCRNEVLLVSEEGSSREKSYEKAYTQTFRAALTSLKGKLNSFEIPADTKTSVSDVIIEKPSVLEDLIPTGTELGNKNILYALPTDTGYKLVNAVPNVIFELNKTTIPDLYLAERGLMDAGIFYKKEGVWNYEYYKKGKLVIEKVEVKF